MLTIPLKILDHAKGLDIPEHATPQSAGVDLYAAIDEDIELKPLERRLIPTGLSIALPDGYEAQIRPRSGLAYKHGLTVLNTPGTIDADYRGEIGVLLVNLSDQPFTITRAMRVAQMIVAQYSSIAFEQVDDLSDTHRGEGGFGSTGLKEVG